jgi:hypothetical protein
VEVAGPTKGVLTLVALIGLIYFGALAPSNVPRLSDYLLIVFVVGLLMLFVEGIKGTLRAKK